MNDVVRVGDSVEWVTINNLDLKPVLWEIVREITYQSKHGNLETDNVQRVGAGVKAIISNVDAVCNVRSIGKTGAALMIMGASKYEACFESGELETLNAVIDKHRALETRAAFRKVDIVEATNARTLMRMPSIVFQDALSSLTREGRSVTIKLYKPSRLISVFQHLSQLGFESWHAPDFLTLMGIYDTDFARDAGIDKEVKEIIDATMNSIKNVTYM
jgi:hypothetical protein